MVTTYGYLRVSTDEQEHGLDAQRATVAGARNVDAWVEDRGVSGGVAPEERPALGPVLEDLAAGDVLVVAKVDRVARSTFHFSALVERARRDGWSLVVCDLGLDLSTPMGEFTAGILAQVAQLERRMIGERTREGLAAARAKGVYVGRPRDLGDDVALRAHRLRELGCTWQEVADALDDADVPTPRGGRRWYTSTARSAARGRAGRGRCTSGTRERVAQAFVPAYAPGIAEEDLGPLAARVASGLNGAEEPCPWNTAT